MHIEIASKCVLAHVISNSVRFVHRTYPHILSNDRKPEAAPENRHRANSPRN